MMLFTFLFLALASQTNAKYLRQLQPHCPVNGWGTGCPTNVDPVTCSGPNYFCVYDNACLASAAGFAGCTPNNPPPPPKPVCPIAGSGSGCPSNFDQVTCLGGDNLFCFYDNACLARAAGFVGCMPTNPVPVPPPQPVCPVPGRGMSCPANINPVKCGNNFQCIYDNDCLANAAGFVGCIPVREECPIPGAGMSCSADINPVKCGNNFQCIYDNDCLANAAGFVGCLPLNAPPPCHPTTTGGC